MDVRICVAETTSSTAHIMDHSLIGDEWAGTTLTRARMWLRKQDELLLSTD